jgi:transcriptional regulator GlxA family with amidase domain
MRRIDRDSEALRLLVSYLNMLQDFSFATPDLRRLAVTHIDDLVALAIGCTRDGQAVALGRGKRAARLQAIKNDILANLADPDLSVAAVALRHKVTARYIHKLFETEGITFSHYVLGERLTRAHCILTDTRYNAMTISTIAYAAGFGDLSYFNRAFRRRYSAAPTEVRAAEARP